MGRNYSQHDLDVLKHSLELAIKFCTPRMSEKIRKHLVDVFVSYLGASRSQKNVCHECLGTGYFKEESE